VVVDGYRRTPEFCTAITRRANSAKVLRSRTPAKLYIDETLLEGLAENFQDVPFAMRESTSERASLAQDGLLC
jgi:hypothetical protein